jgi:glycine cleavage system H protein
MPEKRYAATHEWVEINEDTATIGITDYAQESLGTIVFVDLPSVGKSFQAQAIFGVVESVKSASDLYIPISGEVIEVNEALLTQPELINEAAESTWFIKIRITDASAFESLLQKEAYLASV